MRKKTAGNSPVIVSVSSGKGGVGKTSFTVNLAAALAQNEKRVLLIDGDLGLANVDVVLGLNVRHTIRETVEDGRDPATLLVEITPGFFVLPASSGVPEMASLSFQEQAMLTSTLEGLTGRYDFVLIDTAAGIGDSVLWFDTWAAHNIIILSPDPTSMTDAYALIKILNSRYGRENFFLMINGVRSKKEGTEVFNNMKAVLERFLKITPLTLGSIPQDNNVRQAIRFQKPFLLSCPDSRASIALKDISKRIIAMGAEKGLKSGLG